MHRRIHSRRRVPAAGCPGCRWPVGIAVRRRSGHTGLARRRMPAEVLAVLRSRLLPSGDDDADSSAAARDGMDLAPASDFLKVPAEDLTDAEAGRLGSPIEAWAVIVNRDRDVISVSLDADGHAGTRRVLLDVGQRGIQGMA